MNLTPTQKADELIESLLNTPIDFPYIDTQDGQCIGSGYMTYKSAVRCVIKSVDEILSLGLLYGNAPFGNEGKQFDSFWQEVKQILTDRL